MFPRILDGDFSKPDGLLGLFGLLCSFPYDISTLLFKLGIFLNRVDRYGVYLYWVWLFPCSLLSIPLSFRNIRYLGRSKKLFSPIRYKTKTINQPPRGDIEYLAAFYILDFSKPDLWLRVCLFFPSIFYPPFYLLDFSKPDCLLDGFVSPIYLPLCLPTRILSYNPTIVTLLSIHSI